MRIEQTWSPIRNPQEPLHGKAASGQGPSFVEELKAAVHRTNELQNQAEKAMIDGALRGAKNIHETMIALQEAEIGLKMLVRFRDKALEAYQEIMRMQF
ncbi:flagellar hook-basal body complex protein FliE [Desulfosoma caldarium]|uniref:Flagellar hook-basal body complex protein FliE n=1 Tax=Desulfosoma caldarium TaxID=610254 RepID=A0A3N1VIL0_9BACT|nr:flagellar hook-basal body complex protein FliE [Desulfosoma caldarium]ROR01869.1 flagellar hook-basal body complex protein FliE [Desulfosoma caldarium]